MKNEGRQEQDSVRTTIVGGRPPGSGKPIGPIPKGIEVLMKKASVDKAFRERLLATRAQVAAEIHLPLSPSEAMMLGAIPEAQLLAIIERTRVEPRHLGVFAGKVAALMLAAVGIVSGCDGDAKTAGIAPDVPLDSDDKVQQQESQPADPPMERLDQQTRGIRPDFPTKGIGPDIPAPRPTTPTPTQELEAIEARIVVLQREEKARQPYLLAGVRTISATEKKQQEELVELRKRRDELQKTLPPSPAKPGAENKIPVVAPTPPREAKQ